MAQVISANVYRINNTHQAVSPFGFPVGSCIFRAAPSGTVSQAGVPLYGIVELRQAGLEVMSGDQFYVVETVAQLVTAANA